jgi:aromatic ring-cleaving dioxygenase
VAERFAVRLGTWWDRPVGRLSILVHPNSGRPRQDHVSDRIWIGAPLAIRDEVLPEREEAAEGAGEINTAPTLAP